MNIPDVDSEYKPIYIDHWQVKQEHKKINDNINTQACYDPEVGSVKKVFTVIF